MLEKVPSNSDYKELPNSEGFFLCELAMNGESWWIDRYINQSLLGCQDFKEQVAVCCVAIGLQIREEIIRGTF